MEQKWPEEWIEAVRSKDADLTKLDAECVLDNLEYVGALTPPSPAESQGTMTRLTTIEANVLENAEAWEQSATGDSIRRAPETAHLHVSLLLAIIDRLSTPDSAGKAARAMDELVRESEALGLYDEAAPAVSSTSVEMKEGT